MRRAITVFAGACVVACAAEEPSEDAGAEAGLATSADSSSTGSGPGSGPSSDPATSSTEETGGGSDSLDPGTTDPSGDSTGEPLPPADGDGLLYCDLLRGPPGTFLTCVATDVSEGTPVCIDGIEQEVEADWAVHLESPDPAYPTQHRATVIADASGPVSLCNDDEIEAFTLDDTINVRMQAGGGVTPASNEILYLEDGSYGEIAFSGVSHSAVIAAPGSSSHTGIRFREMGGGGALSNITVAWFDAGDLAGAQLIDFGGGGVEREQIRFVGLKGMGGGGFGTVSLADTIDAQLLGLEIRDGGVPNPDLSHAFYVPNGRNSESRNVVMAYNHIINQTGGSRSTGMQAYGHGPGEVVTSISWRYNYIDGVNRDGILVGASDGQMGMGECPAGPDYGNCWIRQADVIGNVIRNAARNAILIDAGGLEAATSHVEDNDCGGGTIMVSRGDVALANNTNCN